MALGGRIDREPVAGKFTGIDPDTGDINKPQQELKELRFRFFQFVPYRTGVILFEHGEDGTPMVVRHSAQAPDGSIRVREINVKPFQGQPISEGLRRKS